MANRTSPRTRTRALDALLQEAWTGPAWHGPALRQVIADLTPEEAVRKPAGATHSAWGLMLHAAYWKHRVWCRVTGNRGSRFTRRPSNFPAPPRSADQGRWADDVALIERHHAELVSVLAGLDDGDLDRQCGKYTVTASFSGIALHDIYHAGQMRMLQRMLA